MPPVIVSVASMLAYVGAASLAESAILGAILGGVAAFGTSALGSAVFGLGRGPAAAQPILEDPTSWLSNEPSNTAPLPVVYGARRMGGTIVFAEVTGEANEYLDVVYAVCEGEVEGLPALYLNNDLAPVTQTHTRQVLRFSGVSCSEVVLEFKVAEQALVAGNRTGTWDQLVAWEDATYPGYLELSRDVLDEVYDGQPADWQFNLEAVPLDVRGFPDLTVALTVDNELHPDLHRHDIEIMQQPTVENAYTVRLRIRRHSSGVSPEDFAFALWADFYGAGVSQYLGKVTFNEHTGADDQEADPDLVARSSRWTADHRLAGVAYAYVRYEYSPDAYPRGVPTATWDVRGRKVYDPRTSSWAWSDNPALCVLDYLTNPRFGRGVTLDQVELPTFEDAADYCEDQVDDGRGGLVARYTCNGAVDTTRTCLENMEALLRSCRGWLTFVSGKYRLVIDRPAAPVFAFDESNISGAWEISLGDSATLCNRVRAEYYDPAMDYLANMQVADSPELRALDRGVLLEQALPLEYTTEASTAYRLGVIALNDSRQGIVASFDALPRALPVMPGDVVTVTHRRPGWVGKKFRLVSVRLKMQGGVRVTVKEYADAVYDPGEINITDPAPNTQLPTPAVCVAPAAPAVTEQLYETRAGAGVRCKCVVTWLRPADPYVQRYELWARHNLEDQAAAWRLVTVTPATTAELLDVAPGSWAFRLRAINSLGVRSDYSPITQYTVVGLAAAPAPVSGLAAAVLNGVCILTWDQSQDLDVRVGGWVVVRHAPAAVTNPTWQQATELVRVAGSSTMAAVPHGAGTYLAKMVDSTGHESETAAALAVGEADLLGLVVAGAVSYETAWGGTHTGTEVDTGALQLADGQVSGVWEASGITALQLDEAKVYRVRVRMAAAAVSVGLWDDRTQPIDEWPDIDGTAVGVGSAWAEVRPWSGGVWGEWQRLTTCDLYGQVFAVRVHLEVPSTDYNMRVTALTLDALEVGT